MTREQPFPRRFRPPRPRPSACEQCGYSLQGLPSATCPECGHTSTGAPAPSTDSRAAIAALHRVFLAGVIVSFVLGAILFARAWLTGSWFRGSVSGVLFLLSVPACMWALWARDELGMARDESKPRVVFGVIGAIAMAAALLTAAVLLVV